MLERVNKLKNDFKVKTSFSKDNSYRNVYIVDLLWDSNDADYIPKRVMFERSEFEDHTLLQLVLSYFGVKRGSLFDHRNNYGNHVDRNKTFPALKRFLDDYDLMAYSVDGSCHSVDSVDITFYDEDCKVFQVELPRFDYLFSDTEDAIGTFNFLLREQYGLLADKSEEEDDEEW